MEDRLVSTVPPHAPRLAADLMAREPVVVGEDSPLADAARLMDLHAISGLPVLDDALGLVGVISEMDLLRARATEHLWAAWHSLRVRHLMTTPALTILADQPLTVAARRMERHRVSRLVVVAADDERRVIGVLAAADLVRAIAGLADDEPPAGPDEDVASAGDAPVEDPAAVPEEGQ
jgi:CBS domain-containing protein